MKSHALHHLLDQSLRLPAEYGDGLTSHLPMALQALQALGADAARLDAFAQRYLQRFQAAGIAQVAPAPADWCQLRGTADGHAALLAHFQQAVAAQGSDAVLRSALPALLPGVAAAALHGLIRVSHAVQARHPAELAAALAYWAWRWQPLAAPLAPALAGPALAFDDWRAALVEQAPDWTCEAPLIAIRMDRATASSPYQTLAGRLLPAPDLLRRLSRFAAERYAATRNFTVLHMLTAARALRLLQPWLPDTDAVAGAVPAVVVHAMTAAYLAARLPRRAALPPPPPCSWPEVLAAAIACDDEHLIKLVHACREEAAFYGEGDYLPAAQRALATVSPP